MTAGEMVAPLVLGQGELQREARTTKRQAGGEAWFLGLSMADTTRDLLSMEAVCPCRSTTTTTCVLAENGCFGPRRGRMQGEDPFPDEGMGGRCSESSSCSRAPLGLVQRHGRERAMRQREARRVMGRRGTAASCRCSPVARCPPMRHGLGSCASTQVLAAAREVLEVAAPELTTWARPERMRQNWPWQERAEDDDNDAEADDDEEEAAFELSVLCDETHITCLM
ncbi:hypothetical protein ZWY2020_051545 [Hordeum vulgare]|nr:hypothetical protein ZWY2020_051545 [Hordeum vulgare]